MSSICVACRFRPQSEAELAGGGRACVWREQSAERGPEVLVAAREGRDGAGHAGGGSERRGASGELAFAFDHVFAPDASQRDVFDAAVAPLCRDVLRRYNCTVRARIPDHRIARCRSGFIFHQCSQSAGRAS